MNSQPPPASSGVDDHVLCKHSDFKLVLLSTLIISLGIACAFCIVGLKWLVLAFAGIVLILSPFVAIYGPWSCTCEAQLSANKRLTTREFWTRFVVITIGFNIWISMTLFGSPLGVLLAGCLTSFAGFKLLSIATKHGKTSNRDRRDTTAPG
ncbi:hypothetical protein KA344_12145 [bacterium]|nr:hypothetical protein [bacterium]